MLSKAISIPKMKIAFFILRGCQCRLSRNVEVDASFYDADGEVLNSTSFGPISMMAHTSIAGDELEIVITGASIWESYFIEVELDYESSCCGPISKHVWTIEVGEYTFESHRLDAERNWL